MIRSSAIGHRVASVERQVHQHAADLVRVDANESEIGRREAIDGDVLADQAMEHRIDVADDGVEVDVADRDRSLAVESAKLGCE